MSFSPDLSSAFNDTKMRSEKHAPSGMCSFCTEDCVGSCEIGVSAMRGERAVYPTNTGANQVASEKVMPIDYSHFNINGRVFGAVGAPANSDEATIFNVKTDLFIGKRYPVKLALPVILPALIKLNWPDYFAGAAMAGVCCVIGEGAVSKDPDALIENKKIVRFEKLNEMLNAFRQYDRGYGQIIVQVNVEDDALGLPEYAIGQCGAEAIEFKFGQSAKGTQPANYIPTLEAALDKQQKGWVVYPDPSDQEIQAAYANGACANFFSYDRLPMWDETNLPARIEALRAMGMKNVYFKMAGYDPVDMEHVLRLAAICEVDMVTFDGAGGGSGYSPCKMMNEWGYPAVLIEAALVPICQRLEAEGLTLPDIAVTGGFATEDQVYKALALGAPYVKVVGLCRASMAAAMNGKKIGEMLASGNIPPSVARYGSTKEEVFSDIPALRALYGDRVNGFSTGAIGTFSYLKRIGFGLQHFAALNRKFDLKYVNQRDLIPLTLAARDILQGRWF